MARMRGRLGFWAAVALLVALGVALRAWGLGAAPLWLDEAYSAYAADHGWAFLWRVVPLYETHPPVYYSLLHLWVGLAGDGMLALRLLGLIAGCATLPVIALAAGEAGQWLRWSPARRRGVQLAAVGQPEAPEPEPQTPVG